MKYREYLKPEPDRHHWYVETDHETNQIYQGCVCGWKARIRDFYGSWLTYDVGYYWLSHLEGKRVD
jgi:hypothetical protein